MLLDAEMLETRILAPARRWADGRPDVRAVLLVGSHARGAARPDSDVDLVVLAEDPERCVRDGTLAAALGATERPTLERWGAITAVRTWTLDGIELELCFGRPGWITDVPLDPGTRRVLADGARVVLDRIGGLAAIAGGA